MKLCCFIFFFCLSLLSYAEKRTIHVFVALCDNEFQGIVKVPENLGNGKDLRNNLYWGAAYGIKSFFKNKSKEWVFVKTISSKNPNVLERILFRHSSGDVYLLADAYDGEKIKNCISDFLLAGNQQNPVEVIHEHDSLYFGGKSDLVAYVGHDGLMEFYLDLNYKPIDGHEMDAIVLACYSKNYFAEDLKKAKANPLLWTTHLMSPEAYVLDAAISAWILNENGSEIRERAAQSYDEYQKCGIKGARNLFVTGF